MNNDEVKVSITIQIADSEASTQMSGLKVWASGGRHVNEPTILSRAAPE